MISSNFNAAHFCEIILVGAEASFRALHAKPLAALTHGAAMIFNSTSPL
jgi:hypothetical protein